MQTVYQFTDRVLCPFTKLIHEPEHLLIYDDAEPAMLFKHAAYNCSVAGKVSLSQRDVLKSAKAWIAEQVAAKTLVQVSPLPSPKPAPVVETVKEPEPVKQESSPAVEALQGLYPPKSDG